MPIKPFRPPIRQSPKLALKNNYSDDYDYEDDLPKITTAKDTNQPNLLSDYSYDESYESYSSEKNWKSTGQTPVRRVNPVSPSPRPPTNRQLSGGPMRPFPNGKNARPLSRPTSTNVTPMKTPAPPKEQTPAQIEDDYDYDYAYSDKEDDHQIAEKDINPKSMQNSKQYPVDNDIAHPPPPSPKPLPSSQPNPLPSSQPNPLPSSQPDPSHSPQPDPSYSPQQNPLTIQKSNPTPASQPSIQPSPQTDNDIENTFQIVYQQTNLGNFWKRHVQMTKDDVLIYICKSVKKKPYGKVHVICTKQPVELSSPNLVGMIVRHQSGYRFTLYEKGDDIGVANPQLAGIAFCNLKSNSRIRMFRVAIPEIGTSYKPADKYGDLSRIASNDNESHVPNIKVYSSALPIKKEDGTLVLYFGPYSIMRSTKNFVVRDETNSPIFTIFKTFDGICTLKVRPPITPLIGFAIAVAISTSNK